MTLQNKLLKTVLHPNVMTMSRIVAVPLLVILMMYPGKIALLLAAALFSLASITDYLDGYFARKYGLVSNLGKILDPLADKLLVTSAFIMLVSLAYIPAWVACMIIGRELAVTGLRCVIIEQGEDVSASWLGKYKTGFQIAAIIPLLIHHSYFGIDFGAIGSVLLYGALFFTIWSGADYFIKFRKLIAF
ncbi:CDP-diacylglycerol--glycerol-3-phosphate 3-phosphatidyltransferase [Desulfamplus magnetovallimortis]|uniref:CDP-diacylglycerol--glycerol-3-phosphate 3-phosphatidyltransferase n=1 Tax=Desulfamplus magnetovallimortis TaxID=1246637 RepID=A0A1W1HCW0_9BACT|nr:CDP-diacylglycerol--glycerol-3-phosphate 3-phosphatidyltransferase [Desulfamplus magnetovallimortis]SLM30331.1 CDP-diacylglycerol--glycerol-3-phosphate 3-phosphatidyltransferase [Desulfamplus magnetovallimortis]